MDGEKIYSPEDQQRLLSQTEQQDDSPPQQRTKRHHIQTQSISILLTAAITLTIGIFIGRLFQPSQSRNGLLYPTGNTQKAFEHNLTFTQRPDNSSEEAWASIIPIGRGFIHHEEIAPFISNIAVFHQLHCLHAIVIAYYDALESPSLLKDNQIPDWDDATLTRIAIPHIRHCFDYLRQSLMCSADTNLEVLNRTTHTTSGWGQEKVCRDYEGVFEFAERWANSSDRGIVT